jgi:cell division protein FtsL
MSIYQLSVVKKYFQSQNRNLINKRWKLFKYFQTENHEFDNLFLKIKTINKPNR